MKFLEKIRDFPERRKKWITWVIIFLLAVGLGWWWVRDARLRLHRLSPQEAAQEFNLDQLKLPSNETK